MEFTSRKTPGRFAQKSARSASHVEEAIQLWPQTGNDIQDAALHPSEEESLQAALIVVDRPAVEAPYVVLTHAGNANTCLAQIILGLASRRGGEPTAHGMDSHLRGGQRCVPPR